MIKQIIIAPFTLHPVLGLALIVAESMRRENFTHAVAFLTLKAILFNMTYLYKNKYHNLKVSKDASTDKYIPFRANDLYELYENH